MATAVACGRTATDAWMDSGAIVERFPGPACVADKSRRPIATNASWDGLGFAGPGRDQALPGEIAAALLALAHTGRPQRLLMRIEAGTGTTSLIEVTCLPCALENEPGALMLVSDWSEVASLQAALSESRDFHRDLALCSSDATFEIDASGRFTYVGPCGFLGFADFELLGSRMRDLIDARSHNTADFFLTSREPVDEIELWFCGQSGAGRCFMIAAMPVIDGEGNWSGLRGVGRDITEQRAREAEISDAARTRRAIEAVLHAMRSEIRPSLMLGAGCSTLLEVIDLNACFVAHTTGGAFDRIEARARAGTDDSIGGQLAITERDLLDLCARSAAHHESALEIESGAGQSFIIAPTRHARKVNGALVFVRSGGEAARKGQSVWGEEDRNLLRAIASEMGVTLAQLDLFELSPFGRP